MHLCLAHNADSKLPKDKKENLPKSNAFTKIAKKTQISEKRSQQLIREIDNPKKLREPKRVSVSRRHS